ncbi:MAG: segregation/condensation protein A [Candidatus Colwellbacteria bacterium]|nr:segregation/condensation protein A [Candidatus Colwellbacteria bacterium]
MFTVETTAFSGPLAKLLELIEEKKCDVTSVSLASITGDFIAHIRTLDNADSRFLADFIEVAARLMLIKSKLLVPSLELSDEERDDTAQLEVQLKLYKEFRYAERHIQSLWGEAPASHAREFLFGFRNISVFMPPRRLTADMLRETIARLAGEMAHTARERDRSSEPGVKLNLEEYVVSLLERVRREIVSFAAASHGMQKSEIVTLFLALLHLLKDNVVDAAQSERFGEIVVSPKPSS